MFTDIHVVRPGPPNKYRPTSPALRIPTVQTSLASVHHNYRFGVAFVAVGGAGGEAG